MHKILIVCWVTELLQSKMNILNDAGYQISSAVNPEQAQLLASESEFDLIIFGSCVPAQDRSRIAADFKQNHPRTRIIMPYLGSIEKVELADALVPARATPQDLLRAVTHLLGPAAKHGGGKCEEAGLG
jgi:DNA-binding NtrC family response regulator